MTDQKKKDDDDLIQEVNKWLKEPNSFASPFQELVQYAYQPLERIGRAKIVLKVKEMHTSSNTGVAHGGSLSACCDTAMGYAAWTAVLKEGKRVSTVEFKINYFAPVLQGQTVVFEAKTLYRGRSHIVAECVGYVGDKPVVKSVGTFNVYSLRSKAPIEETFVDNESPKAKL